MEANKYWLIATGRIRQRLGSTLIFVDNIIKAHSGAKISATEDDRTGFIDTYPEIFRSQPEMVNFLDPDAADSEEPAGCLYGDVPSTFPTITYQAKSISHQQGDRVNVLFMNGGANDLDFEAFLNPQDHKKDFQKTYDPVFKEIFHNKFEALVRLARQKCPNAVIVITGYFSPFFGGLILTV